MRNSHVVRARLLLVWLALSMLFSVCLVGLRMAAGMSFSWRAATGVWIFIAGLSLINRWTRPYLERWPSTIWPWPGLLAAVTGAAAATVFILTGDTWAAWLVLAAIYLLLLGLEAIFAGDQSRAWRWIIRVLLALVAGVISVVIAQLESGFADEEFFVALQALTLGVFWLAISVASHSLDRLESYPRLRGLRLDRRWLAALLFLGIIVGLYLAGRAYQGSFYPMQAPEYQDVSAEAPFDCGETPFDSRAYDGEEVFRRLLDLVVANPRKGPPEYGMLALGTGKDRWARTFRDSLLEEARAMRFAGPAQSMKAIQYEAALRAYYYPRVRAAFSDLFSENDVALLRDWFAAINRRALTIEWVDWLYGLALAKRPEGPYENQEIGAGLLALLESTGLADPGASPANRDYLRRNPRGWALRFRNTDDAFAYQILWLQNAYFQSLYTGELPPDDHLRLSFEWLLYQALPDGAPVRYNHPDYYSFAGIAYAGAALLDDPRYLWLAGRAVEDAERYGRAVFAQPGAEKSITLTGRAPAQGSCLLYGDSGLPNQAGPLAPDKIVFRDGWAEDASYLLLNLRFSGWHRYKGANTITSVYKGGQLTGDVLSGKVFAWLPEGRSLFRDKRIPRENLNGLLVPRTGMSAVLYDLTGIGGRWAQDPPQNAEVLAFEPGTDLDRSHTRLQNWRGWRHDRWVSFYHDGGPIVVADQATGPDRGPAALAWQFDARGEIKDSRLRLRDDANPAEVVFLSVEPLGQDALMIARHADAQTISYTINNGQARLTTIFLFGPWVGADVMLDSAGQTLHIVKGDKRIAQPLPWTTEIP